MRLTVLGAPGAGKGTQARNLADYYKVTHVSTSDILRQFVNGEFVPNGGLEKYQSDKESLPVRIKNLMDKGELVPDEIVNALLKKRLSMPDCKDGYILDGFPRSIFQAREFYHSGQRLDAAVSISVSDDEIVERISGRVVCSKCGKNFHLTYFPPKEPGTCDSCGGLLSQRKDDKTQTVLHRLQIYHEHTKPIIDFYRERNILVEVSGYERIEKITQDIIAALDKNSVAAEGVN